MKSGEFNDTKSVSDFEDDGDISVNDSEISFTHHQANSDNESTSIPPSRTSTTTSSQVEPHDYSMKRSGSDTAPAIRVKSNEELTGKLNNMADDLLNMSNGSHSSSKRKRKSQNPIKCTNSALDLLIESKMMKLSGEQIERQIGGSRDESVSDDVAADADHNENNSDEAENFTLDLSKNSPSETASKQHEESSSDEAIDLRAKSPPKNSDSKDDEEINNNLLAAKKMFGPKYPPFNFLINSILSKPSANQTSDGESESDVSSTNENEDNRYFPENGSFISVF